MPRISITILWAICSMFIAGASAYVDYRNTSRLFFVLDMEASTTGVADLFFDTGVGHNEFERLPIRPGVFHTYRFLLPVANIKSLRFDPINGTSVVRIKNARIENGISEVLQRFPIQAFKPALQIDRIELHDDALLIRTAENANDPIMVIDNSSLNQEFSWPRFLAQCTWSHAGPGLLSFIVLIILTECSRRWISPMITKVIRFAVGKPNRSIVVVGLISSVASYYPIVFFDKSFVHPVGVGGLYDTAPWIPGLPQDAESEDFRGSDLGPTAWSAGPNSVVQHDSIFRYFEFPFWTRYVGGGIPLYAQGYSMIGDALQWIPVVFRGNSVAWDVKFIIAKAIFAIGMGMLVMRLTGTLLAASLIAISSCFLGFYAYRFNHPAYFVLTYAPWVMFQWDQLGRAFLSNVHSRKRLKHALFLAAMTWLQFNAGTPKEGAVTALFVHGLGALMFWEHISTRWTLSQSLLLLFSVGLALLLVTAPYWLLFLDALQKSITAYDSPHIITLSWWSFIGFFDNAFYQSRFLTLTAPSANLFVFLCMASAVTALHFPQSLVRSGAWGFFLFATAVAFGLIPNSVLLAIPLINNIYHVGDTFSMPMIILALVLAGYGIHDFLAASKKLKYRMAYSSISGFFVLWFIFSVGGNA